MSKGPETSLTYFLTFPFGPIHYTSKACLWAFQHFIISLGYELFYFGNFAVLFLKIFWGQIVGIWPNKQIMYWCKKPIHLTNEKLLICSSKRTLLSDSPEHRRRRNDSDFGDRDGRQVRYITEESAVERVDDVIVRRRHTNVGVQRQGVDQFSP